METQPKTPEKRGEIVDLQISSPEIQIEDLSEEEQFLRKKIIQKSTKSVIKPKTRNSHWLKISYKKSAKMKTRR